MASAGDLRWVLSISDGSGEWAPEGDSQTAVLDRPDTADADPEREWHVILFNDEDHFFHEVEFQLQKATGCSQEVAAHIAHTADREGQAVAYTGDKHDCERVASVLQQINLRVTIEQAP